MTKEIKLTILNISLFAGIYNFFILGLAVALTSGEPGMTVNEIIAHICVWTSLFHGLVSSWLFIYKKIVGNILGLLSSLIAMIGPISIMTDGMSIFWLTISICFVLTGLYHFASLINLRRLP